MSTTPSWQVPLNEPSEKQSPYAPILETMRLYAGWLLAWYALVFALGAYGSQKTFPVSLELFVHLSSSPVIITVACATFLFLLCSSLQKLWNKDMISGTLLSGAWIILTLLFWQNI